MMANKKMAEIDCSPECGFMVRSHDEKEAIQIAKQHAKEIHHENHTDDDMKKYMKMV